MKITLTCIAALLTPSSSTWTSIKPISLYNCSKPIGSALIQPPQPIACHNLKCVKIEKEQVKMHILNHTLEEDPAYKCRMEVYSQCSLFWIPTYNNSFLRMKRPLIEECRIAMEEKVWVGMLLRCMDGWSDSQTGTLCCKI
uniref:DUF19 domain-containing protein n=1 Tax=Caenorhabditis tropicalis TaxID=1561998 RepID=A0A1I7TVI8_9PELO